MILSKKLLIGSFGTIGVLGTGAFAFAQGNNAPPTDRPIPSQACVQALAAKEDVMLSNFDALQAMHKDRLTAHRDALKAAGNIADDTQRQEALKKAYDDMRSAMEQQKEQQDPAIKTAMIAVRSACGDTFGSRGFGFAVHGPKGHFGRMMHKMHPGQELPTPPTNTNT